MSLQFPTAVLTLNFAESRKWAAHIRPKENTMASTNESPQVAFVAQFQRPDVASWIARMLQTQGINAQVSDTNVLLGRHTDQEAMVELWQSLPELPAHVNLLGQAHGMTYVELSGGTVWRWTGRHIRPTTSCVACKKMKTKR